MGSNQEIDGGEQDERLSWRKIRLGLPPSVHTPQALLLAAHLAREAAVLGPWPPFLSGAVFGQCIPLPLLRLLAR